MTLDDRGRTIRLWVVAGVIALTLAALATWLYLPLTLETYCGQLGTGPETCIEARNSPAGLPTSFSFWLNAVGVAVAAPIMVVVVLRFVRKQRTTRSVDRQQGNTGDQSA
ncbi:hypothetical protein C5B85_04630 [Pseudoclavibacter sp. AY1F1]|uniref:hypothetical protein n=1 Tax=Pseudoclavibacter sp. AY1F1 TaxID=2080583 RepID=UPI000CE8B4E1|nr:hypothetical protein [Pseudoclavibacter sp. AY1F1]PPF45952.1 hypothetical protein C5B85_04630 [Pseudoclavibacter sp. AY1F1]